MKLKAIIIFLALSIACIVSCGKGGEDKQSSLSGEGPVKYAKSGVSVFKDQELKTWSSFLSKTEPVSILETLKVQIKGAETEVAKVKLSDGTVVFIQIKYLADKPVVFVEETKAYVRNNTSSKVYAVIPKGTIGFVVQEMGDWTQIYIGQVDGKWITQQWVNGGYSSEDVKIQEAKNFEEAAAVLKSSKSKPDQVSQALAVLKDLSSPAGLFSEAANTLLAAHSEKSISDTGTDDMNGSVPARQEAKVEAAAGLTMREQPGVSSKSVVIIPDGSTVKILNRENSEETIGGKTAAWYQVEWRGYKGWVFGGFLAF